MKTGSACQLSQHSLASLGGSEPQRLTRSRCQSEASNLCDVWDHSIIAANHLPGLTCQGETTSRQPRDNARARIYLAIRHEKSSTRKLSRQISWLVICVLFVLRVILLVLLIRFACLDSQKLHMACRKKPTCSVFTPRRSYNKQTVVKYCLDNSRVW